MRTVLLTLLILHYFVISYTQIGFEEHVLYEIDYPPFYYYFLDSRFGDIDNDGDLDVFFADGSELLWSENTDGLGTFASPSIILDFQNENQNRVIGEDLDNDGDLDLIVSHWEPTPAGLERLRWLENDGQGNFTNRYNLPFLAPYGPAYMITSDLTGNGFKDVVVFFSAENKVKWTRNNGDGTFSDSYTIADQTYELHSFDVDNDSDMDIIRNNWWLENIDGLGSFGNSQNLIPENEGLIKQMHIIDVDLDGYQDIIVSQRESNSVKWFKNTDGFGNFEIGGTISVNADPIWNVHGADVDVDGDIDVISTSETENIIVWYENLNGIGSFGTEQLISSFEQPKEIQSDDLDGDGDIDLLITSGTKISWFENLSILGLVDSVLINFLIYPNPTTGFVTIQSNSNIVQIKVSNNLGQVILSNSNKNSIDISLLAQGLYFVKITDKNGSLGFKKILKE